MEKHDQGTIASRYQYFAKSPIIYCPFDSIVGDLPTPQTVALIPIALLVLILRGQYNCIYAF